MKVLKIGGVLLTLIMICACAVIMEILYHHRKR